MFTSPDLDPSAPPTESSHPPSTIHVKRCQDILTTYVFAFPSRNYVQGMSDLLSPLYVVMEADEVMAYYGFGRLMERQEDNFRRDQSGMKAQLVALGELLALMDPQLHKHLGTSPLSLSRSLGWTLTEVQRKREPSTCSSASDGSCAPLRGSYHSKRPSSCGKSSGQII